jgi:hypothetical protein
MAKILTDDKLGCIKKNIEDFHSYFKPNFDRFNRFREFIFNSTLSDDQRDFLRANGWPELEFNSIEPYISRLRGEFSKNEPSINITAKFTAKGNDSKLIDFLQDLIYQIIFTSNEDNLLYDIFTDTLSGGFSVFKVFVDYESETSFNQNIYMERFFDPTLCVFDKAARKSHKGDGKYSAELFPKTHDQLKDEYGSDISKSLGCVGGSLGDFTWSYRNDSGEKVALVADYYEKTYKPTTLVNVVGPPGHSSISMKEKDYEKFSETWNKTRFEQVPAIIGKPKKANIQSIDRYVICGSKIIEHKKTNWKYLPHIFVDGNSEVLKKGGASYQHVRPYVYNAEGIQNLKNLSGISLADELQNRAKHKIMMPVEAVPEQYIDPLKDMQTASIVLYNQFAKDNPDKPVNPPMAFPRPPIPPEITSTFTLSDAMMQPILGAYDSTLGINGNQISGAAIDAGAAQSNSASVPYLVSYMKAMTQAGKVIMDLIPKCMKTPRTIPIVDRKGKQTFVNVNTNEQDSIKLDYNPEHMDINVKSGVSFEVQKRMSFEMMINLIKISPVLQKMITQDPDGLSALLDNIDMKGIDKIKNLVEKFSKEEKMREAKAEQMAQQQMSMEAEKLKIMQRNNPGEIKKAELQLKAQKDIADIQIKKEQVQIDRDLADSEIKNQSIENVLRAEEIRARNERTRVDAMAKEMHHGHQRLMDIINLNE